MSGMLTTTKFDIQYNRPHGSNNTELSAVNKQSNLQIFPKSIIISFNAEGDAA